MLSDGWLLLAELAALLTWLSAREFAMIAPV